MAPRSPADDDDVATSSALDALHLLHPPAVGVVDLDADRALLGAGADGTFEESWTGYPGSELTRAGGRRRTASAQAALPARLLARS